MVTMQAGTTQQQTVNLLADILDYPSAQLAQQAALCADLSAHYSPAAAMLLSEFQQFVSAHSVGLLEEVYTGFFDLNPLCFPYVGYHLFGESYKRSGFLLSLREAYRAQNFEVSQTDLVDRVSVMLRFLAHSDNAEECAELVETAMIPTLRRMVGDEEAEDASTQQGRPQQQSTSQLEGHSEGEVLAGGFLLGLTEGTDISGQTRAAYENALRATRLVLEALWPPSAPNSATTNEEGEAC